MDFESPDSARALPMGIRTVSPDPGELVGENAVSSFNGANGEPLRLVVDRAHSHSTRVKGKMHIKARAARSRKVVRFHPKVQNFCLFRSKVDGASDSSTSTWLDARTFRLYLSHSRMEAKNFANRTKLSMLVSNCLSNTTVDFDLSNPRSLEIREELVSLSECRGLEGLISPAIRGNREKMTRQLVLMSKKMALDGYLDPDMQAEWIAAKSKQLSEGCSRLARHLAEADHAIATKLWLL